MEADYYQKGRNYELLMKKVFKCDRGKRYGAERSLLIALFKNEQTKDLTNNRIPYKRQFFKVKLYVQKALLKTKKKKIYKNSYHQFTPLLLRLERANTPNDLSSVVNATLRKIIKIENQLKRDIPN
ncbi:MAG: hypothetical protein L3J20_01800 [Flavobacteriaceae bacterium]|nr:hypothetical protein [Flavobacteriaceae bacterium]